MAEITLDVDEVVVASDVPVDYFYTLVRAIHSRGDVE